MSTDDRGIGSRSSWWNTLLVLTATDRLGRTPSALAAAGRLGCAPVLEYFRILRSSASTLRSRRVELAGWALGKVRQEC